MGILGVIGILVLVIIILIILMVIYYFWIDKKLDRNEEIIKKDHLVRLKVLQK